MTKARFACALDKRALQKSEKKNVCGQADLIETCASKDSFIRGSFKSEFQ